LHYPKRYGIFVLQLRNENLHFLLSATYLKEMENVYTTYQGKQQPQGTKPSALDLSYLVF